VRSVAIKKYPPEQEQEQKKTLAKTFPDLTEAHLEIGLGSVGHQTDGNEGILKLSNTGERGKRSKQ